MASLLELGISTGKWDSGLKKAQQSLNNFIQAQGGLNQALDKENQKVGQFVQMMGKMDSAANTSKGQMNDYKRSIEQLTIQYNQMTEAQKKTVGQDYLNSIEQLKKKFADAKVQGEQLNKELGVSVEKGFNFSSVLQELGGKLGINADMMGLVTTGTIGVTAAITASVAATVAATKAWADYNSELEKQAQITSVTTGLQGNDANRMTDAASALAKTYGVDFREVINAANTLMSQFGKTGDEAISLIADGLQGMIQGDGGKLLSMIKQYAPAFQSAGVEASQLVAVIQNSEGGIFTDQNMQAIIMALPKIKMMSESTAKALAGIGIDGQAMAKQVEDGSLTVFQALQQISQAIDDNKDKSRETAAVMQEMFGRQARIAGDNLGKAIATLNTNLEETKTQTGQLGESLARLAEADEKFNNALRETFGYDGWESMSNSIKSSLIGAFADLVESVNDVRTSFYDISRIDVFSSFISGTLNSLGPLGKLVDDLRKAAGLMQIVSGGTLSGIGGKMKGIVSSAVSGTQGNVLPEVAVTPTVTTPTVTKTIPRGGSAGAVWAPIAMQAVGGLSFGRSMKDVQADLSRAQGAYNVAEDEISRAAAKKMVEAYKNELEMMKNEGDVTKGGFADAYTHNFGKDMDVLAKDRDRMMMDDGSVDMKEVIGRVGEKIGALSKIAGGLQQMGIKLPDGVNELIEVMQGAMQVVQGVQTFMEVSETVALTANTTAIGLNTAAMVAMTAALNVNTATEAIPFFRNGGIVPHAATGYFVPGNSMSNDRVPIMANSGELILNRAEQGVIASELQHDRNVAGGTPYVDGEKIYLGMNNFLRRSGKGEIVTSRR